MGDQALEIVTRLKGHWLWAGTEAMITACPIMLMEAREIFVKARNQSPGAGKCAKLTTTGLRSWNRSMANTPTHNGS